jgi:hypothetical protein
LVNVGPVNHHGQQQSQRVDDDVPLLTLDRLGRIVSQRRTAPAVRRRADLATFFQADFLTKGVVKFSPDA